MTTIAEDLAEAIAHVTKQLNQLTGAPRPDVKQIVASKGTEEAERRILAWRDAQDPEKVWENLMKGGKNV